MPIEIEGLAKTLIAGSALTVPTLLSVVFLLGRQKTIEHAASQANQPVPFYSVDAFVALSCQC